jgi:hypothetical protein
MVSRKGLFRLPTRISRVFAVIAKHVVMLLSRIWVTVGCGGIFVVDHGCMTHADIYPVCTWEFSLSLATVHLMHRRCDAHVLCITQPHQMILLNEQLYMYIARSGKKCFGLQLRNWLNRELSYIYRDTFPCTANAHNGLSWVQMHVKNGHSIYSYLRNIRCGSFFFF